MAQDGLGLVYNKRDDSGAAAILNRSGETAAEANAKYLERQLLTRQRQQERDNKIEAIKSDYTGAQTLVNGTWITDRPRLSNELQKIRTADALLRVKRNELGEQQYRKMFNDLAVEKQNWYQQAAESQHKAYNLSRTLDKINAPENRGKYPQAVYDYVEQLAHDDTGQIKFDPTRIVPFDQIDLTKVLTPQNSVVSVTREKPDGKGGSVTTSETFIDPTKFQGEAEGRAKGEGMKEHEYEKLKKEFTDEQPQGNEQDFVNYIKRRMLSGGKYKLRSSSTFTEPTEAEKKSQARVNGNTVAIGNAVISYSSDGDEETWTPSRTDATENKTLDFEDKNGNIVIGRVLNIKEKKGGQPMITIITPSQKVDGVDIGNEKKEIPYGTKGAHNSDKIENEYGLSIYDVRQKVTGSLKVPSGTTTGRKVTATNRPAGAKSSYVKTYKNSTYKGKKIDVGVDADGNYYNISTGEKLQ